jgi:hypothetical protein
MDDTSGARCARPVSDPGVPIGTRCIRAELPGTVDLAPVRTRFRYRQRERLCGSSASPDVNSSDARNKDYSVQINRPIHGHVVTRPHHCRYPQSTFGLV